MGLPAIYPLVSKILGPSDLAVGPWEAGGPIGVTVHHTGDRNLNRVVKWCKEAGVGYHLLIDRDGEVIQTCYLDKRVNHAGKASWLGNSPNRTHIAIAILSWGDLPGGKTWTKKALPKNETVQRRGAIWDAATSKQEATLKSVLAWFVAYDLDPRHFCGHDECALPAGRKTDPGGVLSFTMQDLRNELRAKLILS